MHVMPPDEDEDSETTRHMDNTIEVGDRMVENENVFDSSPFTADRTKEPIHQIPQDEEQLQA